MIGGQGGDIHVMFMSVNGLASWDWPVRLCNIVPWLCT